MFQRRSTLVKLCIAISCLWLGFFFFIAKDETTLETANSDVHLMKRKHVDWVGNAAGAGVDKSGQSKQPVIERPDIDRLRFEQAMQNGAKEEALQRKIQEEEKNRQEEERIRRVRDRVVPPFKNLAYSIGADGNKRNNATASDSLNLNSLDQMTRNLIKQGLIVPKWYLETEVAANPNGTGEFGIAVDIVKENLSSVDRKEFDDGWQKNAFNQYLSDRISLHRALPDVRDEECKSIKYRERLPSTSVIIIFHNEAWTVLLRTVHSVLDRSPPNLIKEIILVDDFSDHEFLKKPLDDYMTKLGKVRVMRGKKREGLIRARLLGASVAVSEVLIFLDSHCECTMGWLEPLLDRIAENRSNVVTPIIDVLNDATLKYQYSSALSTSVGGFDWNLQFNWHSIPERERKRRKSAVDPVWSPTMAGGLFGISREYFEYLGTYDPGMDIWGGENLELSFRIWMCGGILEQVMCSHVGHIFRQRSPYAWRTGTNVVQKNSVRLAEVWMDDHKKYYYERLDFKLGDYGDITSRKELRKRLKCKSFDWYLKEIFPELFIPSEALASGEIRNKANGMFEGQSMSMCVDSSVDKNSDNKPVKLWPCHNLGGNQFWMLSSNGEIRRDESCIDYAGEFVMMYPCHSLKGNQEWIYGLDNTIRHENTNLCVELSEDGKELQMKPCTGIDRQIWYWRRKADSSKSPRISSIADTSKVEANIVENR